MAIRKATRKKTSRERSVSRAREDRRASGALALTRAAGAYSKALDVISGAVVSLARGARALDVARASAVSPDLVKYGLVARLRPADLQRAVHGVSRDLASKIAFARSSDLVVPDGTEEAYGRLVARLAAAADLVSEALEDFGSSLPRTAPKPHPVIRDLILSATSAASLFNRLVGGGRARASVHVSAVRDEIASGKEISFY